MKTSLETLAQKLDEAAGRLPDCGAYIRQLQQDSRAEIVYAEFTGLIKNFLKEIGASDIEKYWWHNNVSCVEFHPSTSQHFRLGQSGKRYEVKTDRKMRGVICIGFDEDLDYPHYDKPEIVCFYIDSDGNATDIELYSAKKWKSVMEEFFDMSLSQGSLKDFGFVFS